MYPGIKEFFGFPDFIDTFFTVLGLCFVSLLALFYVKFELIDNVIYKKCYHGVKFGYVKLRCEKCRHDKTKDEDEIENEETITIPKPINRLGHCTACGVTVEKRSRHQIIQDGHVLKYDAGEDSESASNRIFKSLLKEQLHLRHYPPLEYYPNYCNECVVKHANKNYKWKYKLMSWGDAFGMSLWLVLFALITGAFVKWPYFKNITLSILCYFFLIIILRYLLGKFISPKTQAQEELRKQISIHESIKKALDFIEKENIKEAKALELVRLRQTSRIDEIDKMSGIQFEQRLANYFERCGYSVKDTPVTGDHGADLIIQKDGMRIAIQAKRYDKKTSVGNSAVQEAISGKIMYDCTHCYVITTSYYTKSAIELAAKAKVKLINRNELIRMLGNEAHIRN